MTVQDWYLLIKIDVFAKISQAALVNCKLLNVNCYHIGVSPSGKAAPFGGAIRRFESCHPSQSLKTRFFGLSASRENGDLN